MSIRARMLNMMLKATVRKQFSNLDKIEELRKGGSSSAKLPADLKTEQVDVDGVPAEWVVMPGSADDAVMLYLHGGGFVFGGLDSHRDLAWRLGQASGMRVLVLDYRRAPENPFPAAVDDATTAWRWLIAEGYKPERMAIAGDSAGAGLSVSLMVSIKNLGLVQPGASVLISPWADLAFTGESFVTKAATDPMLSPEGLTGWARLYLGDSDPTAPLASPLNADLSGLPPTKILVGDTEILCSDSERLAEKMTSAGVNVTIDIWSNMPHVFPLFAGLIPEAKKAISDIGQFLTEQIGTTRVS